MRRRSVGWTALLVLSLLVPVSNATAAGTRPIKEEDLFRFVWISDPRISPDGSRVAFVREGGRAATADRRPPRRQPALVA